MSKTILVIDSEMHYGKHLCCVEDEIKCPLWNNDKYICQYCLNTNTKDCPLKPIPEKMKVYYDTVVSCEVTEKVVAMGWNACIDAILKGE